MCLNLRWWQGQGWSEGRRGQREKAMQKRKEAMERRGWRMWWHTNKVTGTHGLLRWWRERKKVSFVLVRCVRVIIGQSGWQALQFCWLTVCLSRGERGREWGWFLLSRGIFSWPVDGCSVVSLFTASSYFGEVPLRARGERVSLPVINSLVVFETKRRERDAGDRWDDHLEVRRERKSEREREWDIGPVKNETGQKG